MEKVKLETSHEKQKEKLKRRDALLISIPMSYLILYLGYIGIFIESVFSGCSLFLICINYGVLGGYTFMGYYSEISPNIGFAYVLISAISLIINITYAAFSFFVVNRTLPKVMYVLSVVSILISFFISFFNTSTEQMFYAMTKRQPEWYTFPELYGFDDNWRNDVFVPYEAKDISRAILFVIGTLLFIFSQRTTERDFRYGFSIS